MDRLNRMLHAAQGMGMGMGSAAPGGVSTLVASLFAATHLESLPLLLLGRR